MDDKSTVLFDSKAIADFSVWLSLDIDSVTWQGRYEVEFEEFWTILFVENLSLGQISKRCDFLIANCRVGPLVTWLSWLKERVIIYSFLHFDCSIRVLIAESGFGLKELCLILRDFFLLENAHLDEEISDFFSISDITDEKYHFSYVDLKKGHMLNVDHTYSNPEDLMKSLEVTLYPEWKDIVEKMKKSFLHNDEAFYKLSRSSSFLPQFKIVRDIIILTLIGIVLISATKYLNKKWEQNLVNQISVYEPQFKWLNKILTFRDNNDLQDKLNFDLSPDTLEEVKDKFKDLDGVGDNDVRYDTESEVVLTSWDSLPKDLENVGQQQSEYEELKKRGYRDSRYGNTKVYRILLKSEDTVGEKEKLNDLLKRYGVTQVDNVTPGKEVPGGMYYNLFVPRKFLKEFIAQVTDHDNAVLYESRTQAGRNPVGKNKVFIWVKSI